MNEDQTTPTPVGRLLDVINIGHALIAKIDVSQSIVDPILYMKREMLLYETYKSTEDENKVIDFFHSSYSFRIAFSSGHDSRGSFAVYPAGNFLMAGSPSEDLTADHKDPVTEIFAILVNVSLDEWKDVLTSASYASFKTAKDAVGPILGWDIADYRSVMLPEELTRADQITYVIATDLWKKAIAI